ncbi:MAG TPA: hypothetical protein VK846_06945 [Candidatus Limnocylindria bacterium]|nr:hypothetical protein [Candidatus Limnocylindria bacterium]
MAEEPFDAERPHDETWWERELHRNEKLMDKYMAVLGDNPDWAKWQNPEDLYNKVHFNIDPPERADDEESEFEAEMESIAAESEKVAGDNDEPEFELGEDLDESVQDSDEEDPDEDPGVNEDYEIVAKQAREFACHVFDLEKVPGNAELLYLSAGKVGANLAGGHGLGYDEEFICGNIVKCRWALSDCEFCREMLEQLHQRTGETSYAGLAAESRHLAEAVRDRIARLRKRVWW